MRTERSIGALFPKTRQAILAATFLEPEKWWYMRELARHLRLTPSSLQRELDHLVRGGIQSQAEELLEKPGSTKSSLRRGSLRNTQSTRFDLE